MQDLLNKLGFSIIAGKSPTTGKDTALVSFKALMATDPKTGIKSSLTIDFPELKSVYETFEARRSVTFDDSEKQGAYLAAQLSHKEQGYYRLVGSGLMKYLQRKEDVDPVAFCDFVANRPTPDFSGRTTNILAEVSNQFKVSQLQNWNPERMLREEIELRRNKIDKAERQLSQLEQASPEDAAKMLNYLIATRAIKDGYFVRESKDTKVNSSSEIEFAE